jgi:hypothetical protein
MYALMFLAVCLAIYLLLYVSESFDIEPNTVMGGYSDDFLDSDMILYGLTPPNEYADYKY